jgi:PhnB protein
MGLDRWLLGPSDQLPNRTDIFSGGVLMQVNAHLNFNGRCEEAFKFYQQCFGGVIQTMLTYADTPAAYQVPPELQSKIIHATLNLGETMLMGADAPSERYEQPRGFSVALQISDPSQAEKVFRELSEGGTVQLPLQETFWAARFGMLVDRFGVPWMINCGKPA